MTIKESINFLDSFVHSFCSEKKEWIILDDNPKILEGYGKDPRERDLSELLEKGIIVVDKPPGPTSHEVVSWLRKMLGVGRVGHGGTLEESCL